jgi:hypothetical protein
MRNQGDLNANPIATGIITDLLMNYIFATPPVGLHILNEDD